MRVVQIGDLMHDLVDLHLSIFPSLVSDRRSEPIINHNYNHIRW